MKVNKKQAVQKSRLSRSGSHERSMYEPTDQSDILRAYTVCRECAHIFSKYLNTLVQVGHPGIVECPQCGHPESIKF